MSGFQGLDPEAVDRLGVQLIAQAKAIEDIASAVDGLVHHASSIWHGVDVGEFMNWWTHRHRPATLAASVAVHGLGQSAQRNAAQQRGASDVPAGGAHSGGGFHLGLPSMPGWALRTAPFVIPAWRMVDGVHNVLDTAEHFAHGANVAGRYTDRWRLVNNVLGDFARYKSSPILHALHGFPGVQSLAGVAQAGGHAMAAVGIVGTVVHAGEIGNSAYHHYKDGDELGLVTDAGHAGAMALKRSPNPVAYLGGAALEAVTMDVELARQVDWSAGFPPPTVDNLRHAYLPALGDSMKQLPGRLLQVFG